MTPASDVTAGVPRVGLIVNPFAGRDVRRIIAPAGMITNYERTNIVRCLLGGLAAAGVRDVLYLPERYGIVERAAAGVPGARVAPVLEDPEGTPADTSRAARAMAEAGVGVLVTLGGDGTNRLAALGGRGVPMLPVPAGTNNAFAAPVEPTGAGFAAGMVATLGVEGALAAGCLRRRKRITVEVDGRSDLALVDAVLTTEPAVGARAVWQPEHLRVLVVSQAEPGAIGLSSLAAALLPIDADEPRGAVIEMGPGARVVVPLTPGVFTSAEVQSVRAVPVGERIVAGPATGTVSLDGERTFELRDQVMTMALEADGPWVVDVPRALAYAQRSGWYQAGRHQGTRRAVY